VVFTWAPAIDGAFVLTTRGGDFALHIGQDLSIGYLSHSDTAVRTKGFLVDLVGFEPTTSSMPFKKYQSLADSLARNKRLSTRPTWTPVDATGRLLGVWTPRGLQDSNTWLARGVLSCARGCRLLYLLSSEGDNNRFPYKDDAHERVVVSIVLARLEMGQAV
jgi:hypothetical protein